MIRGSLIAAVGLLVSVWPAAAHADTHIWSMTCSEDQVINSGVGDGTTDSTATGTAAMRYDTLTQRLHYDVSYNGLEGLLTNIHIHGPALAGFGNSNHVFDIFSDADEVIASGVDRTTDRVVATDELLDLILDSNGVGLGTVEENADVLILDQAYVNVHTDVWPGGEIRCQFLTSAVLVGAEQTKDQQKCTSAMVKGLGKVASTKGKGICKCVKDFTKGKLTGTLEACVGAADDKVGKAQGKVSAAFTKRCTGNDKDGVSKLPAFGVTDDATVNAAAVLKEDGLVHAVFGADLDAVVDGGTDAALGKCQSAVLKTVKKCQDTRLKEYGKCVKGDLKGKGGLTIVDDFGLEQCLLGDAKGKIAGACDAETGKLGDTVGAQCGGVDLLSAFPPCATADPAAVAACLDRATRCAVCLAVNASEGTTVDCDLYDDGAANLTCVVGP